MLDRVMKSIVVLTLALFLGRALIGMLLGVVAAAAFGVASGIGRVGSMFLILLAFTMVVGVLVRGKDALGRLIRPSGRGRHGDDPNARFARRDRVAGDTTAPGRPNGSPRRRARPRGQD